MKRSALKNWAIKILAATGAVFCAYGFPLDGDAQVIANAKLEKAIIEVVDSSFSLRATYSGAEPDHRPVEAFLRTWAELPKDKEVYFAASENSGKLLLSLISEPGEWDSKEFPRVEVIRLAGAGAFDQFQVKFETESVAADHQGRFIAALTDLIAVERSSRPKPPEVVRGGEEETSSGSGPISSQGSPVESEPVPATIFQVRFSK